MLPTLLDLNSALGIPQLIQRGMQLLDSADVNVANAHCVDGYDQGADLCLGQLDCYSFFIFHFVLLWMRFLADIYKESNIAHTGALVK